MISVTPTLTEAGVALSHETAKTARKASIRCPGDRSRRYRRAVDDVTLSIAAPRLGTRVPYNSASPPRRMVRRDCLFLSQSEPWVPSLWFEGISVECQLCSTPFSTACEEA